MMAKENWFRSKKRAAPKITLLLLLLALPVGGALLPPEWITGEGHTLCLWANITGESCYGCGMTRAAVSLLHLQFVQAWHYNGLIVVVMPLLAVLWARWVWRLMQEIRHK